MARRGVAWRGTGRRGAAGVRPRLLQIHKGVGDPTRQSRDDSKRSSVSLARSLPARTTDYGISHDVSADTQSEAAQSNNQSVKH